MFIHDQPHTMQQFLPSSTRQLLNSVVPPHRGDWRVSRAQSLDSAREHRTNKRRQTGVHGGSVGAGLVRHDTTVVVGTRSVPHKSCTHARNYQKSTFFTHSHRIHPPIYSMQQTYLLHHTRSLARSLVTR